MGIGGFMKKFFKSDDEGNEVKEYYQIDFTYYTKLIYLIGLSEEKINELLQIHYELEEEGFHLPSEFYITVDEEADDLVIIKCPLDIDFYEYHNLISCMECNVEDDDNIIYGIAINSVNTDESYYVYIDEDYESYDTLCGVMNNGNAFSIYLPESYIEGGNMELDDESEYDIVGVNELIEWLREDEDEDEDEEL